MASSFWLKCRKEKKVKKIQKNMLTKVKRAWYIIKAPLKRGAKKASWAAANFFKKKWKNMLTKRSARDIINTRSRLRRRRQRQRKETRFVPCKLNNVTDNNAGARYRVGPILSAWKKLNFAWSKAQKKISINDINFLESLILAQDERWRRA